MTMPELVAYRKRVSVLARRQEAEARVVRVVGYGYLNRKDEDDAVFPEEPAFSYWEAACDQ